MATRGDVDSDLAVVDIDVLVCPTPVPVVADSGDSVVECQVATCELLIAKCGANVSTVEDKVTHIAGGTWKFLVRMSESVCGYGVYKPLSMKSPWCLVPDAELISKTMFSRLVAWAVGQ
jgi:hypothetical protein